ncbi:ABC transporter ATP-binding protein [Undibacter mobilis]|uniref:ABC transporter ATP-binding protein n=1 Tax=Undibacter mobilis TaxID=2292256 RepID=A0A371B183_9BRAD|nr:ABC transporter ATP-binding protein [Undibacter mobilis]RDV01287.1 ABC transporter ATP-binding protein [Undibacter mobilis]
MSASDHTILLENVTFTYPGTDIGVHDVSLGIRAGELLAVIGPSGCGKSTLLKIIAGFVQPSRGRVIIAGKDAAGIPPRERNIGIVFQSYSLFPHMTVLENVAYPLKLRGRPVAERRANALDILGRVGLKDHIDKLPAQLSGGQQQRVALARALVFDPQALLLDEPLSALDAALRVEMRDEIRRLQRAHHIATMHITHDQEEALSMADRVAVMRDGRLVQVDAPKALYAQPANRAVASFIGHANLWRGRVVDGTSVETPLGILKTAPHGFAAGEPIVVLVRPEKLAIGSAADGVNTLTGKVTRDRFLGSFRRFDFEVGGTKLLGETGNMAEIRSIHILPEAVQLLADHDGKRP